MQSYELGQSVILENAFTDADGAPANPSTVTCTVTRPDLTETAYTSATTPAVTNPVLGTFRLVLAGDQAGIWYYTWVGISGQETPTDSDVFAVTTIQQQWTYSGNPSLRPLDSVRFMLGDTQADDPQLLDSEIAYLLADCGSPRAAAIEGCLRLVAKYARLVDASTDGLSGSHSQRVEQYQKLADRLKRRGTLVAGPIIGSGTPAGGSDSQSFFTRESLDFPGPSTETE